MGRGENFFKQIIIILLFLTLLPIIHSADDVKIEGYVNDYANIISPEYKAKIEGVLKELYVSGTAEFSIVTIKSLEGQDIESYALNLAQGKLGDNEKNNGLLLLVAVEDRKYRFEVGRGIEPVLNDAKVGRIGRNYLVENFRSEEYGKGIYEASLAVKSILLEENNSSYYVDETAIQNIPVNMWPVLIFLIIWVIIFVTIISVKVGYYKKHIKKKDDYFGAALMAAWLFGGRGRGGHGGFSGGFGGGGFGGFGGGGFGGGGAGGHW